MDDHQIVRQSIEEVQEVIRSSYQTLYRKHLVMLAVLTWKLYDQLLDSKQSPTT